MEDKNINNLLIIFGITLTLLIANSYVPEGVEILGFEFKQVDFLSDIRSDGFYDSESDDDEYYDEDGDDYIDDEYEDEEEQNDTSLLEAKPRCNFASIINMKFITEFVSSEIDKLSNNSIPNSPPSGEEYLTGNLEQLNKFFASLKNVKSQQIRIAHYGDSALEGDLISSDLRELFQKKFGGEGVGMVPITSQDTKFRKTTDLSFSDDWTTATLFSILEYD